MKKRKRKRKKTSGSRLIALVLLFLLPGVCAEKRKAPQAYGLVGGTVFREPGFALAGAEVSLTANPQSGTAPAGSKPQRALTGARGEFAFRVPISAMRYVVHAEARGYAPQEKTINIEGELRVEVTFLLAPESK